MEVLNNIPQIITFDLEQVKINFSKRNYLIIFIKNNAFSFDIF